MKDRPRRKSEVDCCGVGPGLSCNLVPHVRASIGSRGGSLCGQHGGEMASFVEEITGIKQSLRVDDKATRLERDTGQERFRA